MAAALLLHQRAMPREQNDDDDLCIRCGGQMVHVGFKIYRCSNCGHEEKPEDLM